jgi:hypothetical protein
MLKSKISDHANSVNEISAQLSPNHPATHPIPFHSNPPHPTQLKHFPFLSSPLLSSPLLSSPLLSSPLFFSLHLSSPHLLPPSLLSSPLYTTPILSNTTTSLRLPSLKYNSILPNLTAFHHLSSLIRNHLNCSDLILSYNMI